MKDIFRKLQEKVAYATLQMSDEDVDSNGGMTKEQARKILAVEVLRTFKKQYPQSYKTFIKMTKELTINYDGSVKYD